MAPLRVALTAPATDVLGEVTAAYGGLDVFAYDVGGRLLLAHRGPEEARRALARRLGLADAAVQAVAGPGHEPLAVSPQPDVERVLRAVEALGATLLPPIVWREGRFRMEAVVVDADQLDRLLAAVPGARLESRRTYRKPRSAVPGALLDGFTPKQAEALMAAVRHGYYESPRRVTTAEVAKRLRVSRSTFEEHLRAAEARVVHAVAPFVRLRATPADGPGEALDAYERFSEELGLYVHMTMRGDTITRLQMRSSPASEDLPDHPYLARILQQVTTGEGDLSDIPVDVPLGPFEQRVLETLRTIPPGEVVTYGDLAKRLGKPRAARAVGNAVRRNPIPLLIPCHRVVPATGGVGNYSGGKGPPTKRILLWMEGAALDGAVKRPASTRGARPRPR